MDESFERARTLFLAGVNAFESGRYTEAASHFEASRALLPERSSTLNNLASVRIKLNEPHAALALLDDVLAREPADVDALAHRGAALGLLGRHVDALACYDRVLAQAVAPTPVLFQRAMTLGHLERDDEAIRGFDALLALEPGHAEAWLRRGQSLLRLNRHEDALASWQKALDLDPTLAEAWTHRGALFAELQRYDEAAEAFEQAIAHGGDPQINRFFLAGLNRSPQPSAAPRPYVETMFDDYAEAFDAHLVEVLRYGAHNILIERLRVLRSHRFERALDLGCGTGLCGVLLQPIVETIDGVDLSSNMLEKASARNLYATLFHADAGEHLHATDRRYDLVVAADVFIYIGDLSSVFAGVQRLLEPGGAFCFTTEMNDGDGDYALRTTLRYAHSEAFIRRLAAGHGFTIEAIDKGPVREDQQQPIPGLFVFLTKQ